MLGFLSFVFVCRYMSVGIIRIGCVGTRDTHLSIRNTVAALVLFVIVRNGFYVCGAESRFTKEREKRRDPGAYIN